MNKTFLSLLFIFMVFGGLVFTTVDSYGSEFGTEGCYDQCNSGRYDEDMKELCLGYHDEEFFDKCMDTWGDEYADDCLDEFNAKEFDGEMEYFNSGAGCLEEFSDYFEPICFYEDHYDELGEECLNEYHDEMIEECVDMPFAEYGVEGCCPNSDDIWVEELGECVDSDFDYCVSQGKCSLDGGTDPWDPCDGYLGDTVEGASSTCITEDEFECLDTGQVWIDGECYDENEVEKYVCEEENNLFWSEDLNECFYSEEAKICNEENKYYSEDLNECFDDYDELRCVEDGLNYYEGNCYEEEAFECAQNNEFYCSESGDCVEDETMCCEEGLYVDIDGVCAESIEEADCKNNGYDWDDGLEKCIVDDYTNSGVASDLENGWTNDFPTSGSESNSNEEGSTQRSKFVSAEYNPSGNNHNYIYPATTVDKFELYSTSEDKINANSNIGGRATAPKFSPDGKSFIFGTYVYNSENFDDRRIEYNILSYNSTENSVYGKFKVIKQNAFYQHDYENALLLDWNKEDHSIYFLSKGTNDAHNDFKVRSYYTGLNNGKFESKRIEDLSKVFNTEFQAISKLTSRFELFDAFVNTLKSTVNNVYTFNPIHPEKIIVGYKRSSSNVYNPFDTGFNLLTLEHGQIYNDLKTFVFGVDYPTIKLPNTRYYKFSSDGKYLLSYVDNSFKIAKFDKVFSASNDPSITNIIPDYLLERIIPNSLKNNEIVTDFSFDSRTFGENKLPKGIFYSVYNKIKKTTRVDYVSLEDGSYFTIYNINKNVYIDDLEINPEKNEMLVHYCSYLHPESDAETYMGMNIQERFLDCELVDVHFNRKLHFVINSDLTGSNLRVFGNVKLANRNLGIVNFKPSLVNNKPTEIKEDDLKNSILLASKSKSLYDLSSKFKNIKVNGIDKVKVNKSKKAIGLINFNLRKELMTKDNLVLTCDDLRDVNKVRSKIQNKDLLLLNIYSLKEKGCENALTYNPIPKIDCKFFPEIKEEVIKGDFKNKASIIIENTSTRIKSKDLVPIYQNLIRNCKDLKERNLGLMENLQKFDPNFKTPKTDLEFKGENSVKTGYGKMNNPMNISPFEEFLNVLKENQIINIQGIRNDSSIQYLSIDLSEGNVREGENDGASLLFIIKQNTIEDIFETETNLGQAFFDRVVTGEIKMKKVDNSGVFESLGNWLGSLVGVKTETNLTVKCPSIRTPVCGDDGQTYTNGCFANNNDVKIAHMGEC